MRNKTILWLALLTMAVMLAGLTSAADYSCTVAWPNATNMRMNLTAGYNNLQVEVNGSNVTARGLGNYSIKWYVTSAGGSEALLVSNSTVFGNATDQSDSDGLNWNQSRTTLSATTYSALSDATTYTVTAKLFINGSATASSITCSQTFMYFDRTSPVCAVKSPTANSENEPPFTVTVTGTNASQAMLYVKDKTYNMSRSSLTFGAETYTFAFDNKYSLADGIYSMYAICKDNMGTGGDTTTSATTSNIEVYESPSAYKGVIIDEDIAKEAQAKKQSDAKGFLAVAAIVVGIWLLARKKKK